MGAAAHNKHSTVALLALFLAVMSPLFLYKYTESNVKLEANSFYSFYANSDSEKNTKSYILPFGIKS